MISQILLVKFRSKVSHSLANQVIKYTAVQKLKKERNEARVKVKGVGERDKQHHKQGKK